MLGVGLMVLVVGLGSSDPELKSHLAVELIPGGVDSACRPSEVSKMSASFLVSCVGVATRPGLCPIADGGYLCTYPNGGSLHTYPVGGSWLRGCFELVVLEVLHQREVRGKRSLSCVELSAKLVRGRQSAGVGAFGCGSASAEETRAARIRGASGRNGSPSDLKYKSSSNFKSIR